MADFPPNIDDGELWLPADICSEISYPIPRTEGNFSKRAFAVDEFAMHHAAQGPIKQEKSATITKFEVFGTWPNGSNDVVNVLPNDIHGLANVYHHSPLTYQNGGVQNVPGPTRMYPFIQPQFPVKSFNVKASKVFPQQQLAQTKMMIDREMNRFAGNSGGTCVFLPQCMNLALKKPEETKGTPSIVVPHRKKKTAKKSQAVEMGFDAVNGVVEETQEMLTELPIEFYLPKEWIY